LRESERPFEQRLFLAIATVSGMGVVVSKQNHDRAAVLGISLIVTGVVVLNLFSRNAAHGSPPTS